MRNLECRVQDSEFRSMRPLSQVFLRQLIACCLLFTILRSASHAAFVYETETELQTTGDFDGDGRTDLLIADKPSGTYRIAYQLSEGILTWTDSRVSGIQNLTGLSVGTLLATTSDAIAFTSIEANRVHINDASNPSAPGETNVIFYNMLGAGIGPQSVLAIDIPSYGTAGYDDMHIISTQNDPASGFGGSNVFGSLVNDSTSIEPKAGAKVLYPMIRANRFYPVPGATNMSCYLNVLGQNRQLRIADGNTTGNSADTAPWTMFPADYICDSFGSHPEARFVTYYLGLADIYIDTVHEASPGNYEFTTSGWNHHSLANHISRIYVVSASGTNELLILREDYTLAEIYSFDGSNRPTLKQSGFTVAAGSDQFTGALKISDTDFLLFSGTTNGTSHTVDHYTHNGSDYKVIASEELPQVKTTAGTANVMVYEEEPFVTDFPKRRGAWHIGDWTTNVTAGANVEADYLTDNGLSSGLGSSSSDTIASTPSGTAYALGNQHHEAISVFSFDNAYGPAITDIRIDPAPGAYDTSVLITLTNSPATPISYRVGNGAWYTYSEPFWVYEDTIVAYYSTSGSEKSPLYFAPYTFSITPDQMDSDNDGVPDYVELAYGLDPVESGVDADGDGLSDLDELIQGTDPAVADTDQDSVDDLLELRAGTDPLSTNSVPTLPVTNNYLTLVQQDATYNLAVIPRPKSYNSVIYTNNYALKGMQMRTYDANGGMLSSEGTTKLNAKTPSILTGDPGALFEGIPVDQHPNFVIVDTEENYPINRGTTNDIQGREMLAIYPVPEISSIDIGNTYSNRALATEAAAWLNIAQSVYTNNSAYDDVHEMNIFDTLTALLYERMIGDILEERGETTNRYITLFPFRTSDTGLNSPTANQLLAIENQPTGTLYDAYRLLPMLTNIHAQVLATNTLYTRYLYYVTERIYSISSQQSQTNPGIYRQPVNILRDFIYYGQIDTAYTNADNTLSKAVLDAAYHGAWDILDSLPSRPSATYTLQYRTNSINGNQVTLFPSNDVGTAKQLYAGAGQDYTFPQSIQLIPGSILQVSGYTDLEENCAPADPLEVLSIALQSIPVGVEADRSGNQLPDSWELENFGSTGHDATGDDDADGYSNLHEYLGASNAGNSNSTPEDIDIAFEANSDGTLRLDWPWWEDYVTNFVFTAESTGDLMGQPFNTFETAPEGNLFININPSSITTTSMFFRIAIEPRK